MEYIVDTKLFPDMQRFISWVHSKKLHTYFNDHPEAPGERKQMSPEEVNFRWNGLTSMFKLGLDFWWYDSNWVNPIIPGAFGLDNKVWVQAVYRWVTTRFNSETRPDTIPFTLAMFTSSHPAHHRFPVWWTGDIWEYTLLENVGFTVDGGVQLKPYVHPDCTGHMGRNSDEEYARWIQFCAMSNLIRIHSNTAFPRQPWTHPPKTEAIVKGIIDTRYSLLPSIISAGHRATDEGAPVVKRLDLEWPEHADARRNDQYLLAEDILVAPIIPFPEGNNSRMIWIPPGSWEDAWTGKVINGPKRITVTMPVEQIPMFYRRASVIVTAAPTQTTAEQDWSHLFIEAFPGLIQQSTAERQLHDTKESESNPPVHLIRMVQPSEKVVSFTIEASKGPAKAASSRSWTIRVHPAAGTLLVSTPHQVTVDGITSPVRVSQPGQSLDQSPSIPFIGTSIEVDIPASKTGNHVIVFKW